MATPLDNLQSQFANAVARLAEMDAVPLTERARMSYEDKGRQFGWNEYRASLQSVVDKFAEQVESYLKGQQMIGGPFTVIAPVGGNCGW
jgi:hypothetical protein